MARKKATEPETIKATVTGGNLNIRKKASKDSDIVGVLRNGQTIEILTAGEEWSKVKDGYVMSQYLAY